MLFSNEAITRKNTKTIYRKNERTHAHTYTLFFLQGSEKYILEVNSLTDAYWIAKVDLRNFIRVHVKKRTRFLPGSAGH